MFHMSLIAATRVEGGLVLFNPSLRFTLEFKLNASRKLFAKIVYHSVDLTYFLPTSLQSPFKLYPVTLTFETLGYAIDPF